MAQTLIDSVVAILAPELGNLIARAAVSMYLTKTGLTEADVKPQHLAALAQAVKPGLKTFVGGGRADALAAKIVALGEERARA